MYKKQTPSKKPHHTSSHGVENQTGLHLRLGASLYSTLYQQRSDFFKVEKNRRSIRFHSQIYLYVEHLYVEQARLARKGS